METVKYHSPDMRREQVVARDKVTIPARFVLYETHDNTYLTEGNLRSKPLPSGLLMITPNMANAVCRHERVIELELP
jgi:hypothetical protein